MPAIPLTQGKYAIVDDEDYEYLCQWRWYYTSAGYAARRNPRSPNYPSGQIILMHRQILNPESDMSIDHIDRNPLNNVRSNLRLAAHWQNLHNRPKQINNTSGHKGVCWSKREQKWKGFIDVQGKRLHLGTYADLPEAIADVMWWRQQLCGEFAHHA